VCLPRAYADRCGTAGTYCSAAIGSNADIPAEIAFQPCRHLNLRTREKSSTQWLNVQSSQIRSNSQRTLAQSGVPGLGRQGQSSYAEVNMATQGNLDKICPLAMVKPDKTIYDWLIAAPRGRTCSDLCGDCCCVQLRSQYSDHWRLRDE
jgi:hypothetical protein